MEAVIEAVEGITGEETEMPSRKWRGIGRMESDLMRLEVILFPNDWW